MRSPLTFPPSLAGPGCTGHVQRRGELGSSKTGGPQGAHRGLAPATAGGRGRQGRERGPPWQGAGAKRRQRGCTRGIPRAHRVVPRPATAAGGGRATEGPAREGTGPQRRQREERISRSEVNHLYSSLCVPCSLPLSTPWDLCLLLPAHQPGITAWQHRFPIGCNAALFVAGASRE